VRSRADGTATVSPAAIASCTSADLRRSATTLTWAGAGEVNLVPYQGHGYPSAGLLAARLSDVDDWELTCRDDVIVRAPGGEGIDEDPDAPVPTVVASLS